MSEKADQESGGLKGALDNLNERERLLVKVMLGVFAALALFVVIGLTQRSIGDLEDRTAQYEAALDLIAEQGPDYVADQGNSDGGAMTRADLFTEEVLQDNTVALTGFVATHAEAVGLSPASYNNDEHPLGSGRSSDDEGPMIVERQLRVDIRDAEMDRVVELLHRIEESREPVITKRIDIRSVRDEGNVRALIVISTYLYSTEEES